ncbi:efflux RND transporter periplasmic adaptor subunit [Blastococcus sp. TF02A-26]|uniref:efflux RND transporter periplasmic adaptor subunit n=1 Tax=Blastococcus sp. TF02A-26 TaxID=2250577 RepID=UPI00131431C9|nr:peptidoglycan-binding protein [Blastococcus sp. TF02A-26]
MSRRVALAVGAVALLVAVSAGAIALAGGTGEQAPDTGRVETRTAEVQLTTLLLQEDVSGTLGYGATSTVVTDLAGKITLLAAEGSVVERGQVLFGVDGRRAVLLYGDSPLYRTLQVGVSDGPDVRLLEQNLIDLGHGSQLGGAADEHFDSRTARAVRAWQETLQVEQTGTVDLGAAVVAPGAVRVAGHATDVGGVVQPGAAVLQVTGTTPLVEVELDARTVSVVQVGDPAGIELPDGRVAAGTVASVSTVAVSQPDGGPDAGERTVTATVRFDDPAERGGLDGAAVDVQVTRGERPDVLAVPVEALLALADGGHAVETVTEAGGLRLVPVETGAFAQGLVEVTGAGLSEGTRVTVPS